MRNKPSKRTGVGERGWCGQQRDPEGLLKHRQLAQPQSRIPVGPQHPTAPASDHAVAGSLGSVPRTPEQQQIMGRRQILGGGADGL